MVRTIWWIVLANVAISNCRMHVVQKIANLVFAYSKKCIKFLDGAIEDHTKRSSTSITTSGSEEWTRVCKLFSRRWPDALPYISFIQNDSPLHRQIWSVEQGLKGGGSWKIHLMRARAASSFNTLTYFLPLMLKAYHSKLLLAQVIRFPRAGSVWRRWSILLFQFPSYQFFNRTKWSVWAIGAFCKHFKEFMNSNRRD